MAFGTIHDELFPVSKAKTADSMRVASAFIKSLQPNWGATELWYVLYENSVALFASVIFGILVHSSRKPLKSVFAFKHNDSQFYPKRNIILFSDGQFSNEVHGLTSRDAFACLACEGLGFGISLGSHVAVESLVPVC
jgi:hypothetical protein